MSDPIKKEDALMDGTKIDKALAMGEIRSIPSADRPQGEWIDIEPRLNRRRVNKYKRCSHCGFSWARPFDDNYCPSCGAIMYTEMSNADLLYDECKKIIKAIDTIDDFLIKYSEFWNDITWRSNIDGHELYVDWGYFKEGMREIKSYCKQLNGQK